MNMIKMENDFKEHPANIKIIGVGGAGGNAVNRMIEANIKGVEFIAANTDAQALRTSYAGLKLQLGQKIARGLGVGGNPVIGKEAALEDKEKIKESLIGADMVFVTAGMGGGTGTGGAPIVAELAQELGALTVGVVTKPFLFEGKIRSDHAENGIKELKGKVDTLIIIPNQRLFGVIDSTTPAKKAWGKVDDVLRQAIQSISDVITSIGTINVDFNDVKAIMTNAGEALMGLGEGTGDKRAEIASNMAIASPLLEDISIDGARGVLVNITGNKDLTMFEINEVMTLINKYISTEANIYFGQVFDESVGDKIKVTVIATNFSQSNKIEKKQQAPNKIYKQQDLFNAESSYELNDLVDKLDKPAYLRKKKKDN